MNSDIIPLLDFKVLRKTESNDSFIADKEAENKEPKSFVEGLISPDEIKKFENMNLYGGNLNITNQVLTFETDSEESNPNTPKGESSGSDRGYHGYIASKSSIENSIKKSCRKAEQLIKYKPPVSPRRALRSNIHRRQLERSYSDESVEVAGFNQEKLILKLIQDIDGIREKIRGIYGSLESSPRILSRTEALIGNSQIMINKFNEMKNELGNELDSHDTVVTNHLNLILNNQKIIINILQNQVKMLAILEKIDKVIEKAANEESSDDNY